MGQGKEEEKRGDKGKRGGGAARGAPNLPDIPQLFGDELGWTAGLQREESRGHSRCEPWPGPARHPGVTAPSLLPASSTAAAAGMFFSEEVAAAVVWGQAVGGRRAMESEWFSVVACTPLCHLSMSQ